MKQLVQKLTLSLFLTLFSINLWAKPVARVVDFTGAVFAITPEGKTVKVKNGMHLNESTSLMLEDDSAVSLTDFYDNVIHVAGGSQITVEDRFIELTKGHVWFKSIGSTASLKVQSSNAILDVSKSESIVSYDSALARTNLLTLAGEAKIANAIEESLYQRVQPGMFSFVDKGFDDGYPRIPTMIGFNSYQRVTGVFYKVQPNDNAIEMMLTQNNSNQVETEKSVKREIASVTSEKKVQTADGKKSGIIFISTKFGPKGEAHQYYKSLKKTRAPASVSSNNAEVRVFGSKPNQGSISRSAAAKPKIVPVKPVVMSNQSENTVPIDFDESLSKAYHNQKRHTDEVNRLIDELQSFDKDYKKKY
jgi:hypothetical protein